MRPRAEMHAGGIDCLVFGHSCHWTGADANQLAMTASQKTEASLPTQYSWSVLLSVILIAADRYLHANRSWFRCVILLPFICRHCLVRSVSDLRVSAAVAANVTSNNAWGLTRRP